MNKKYMPVSYVDENGEIHEKNDIKEKLYKIIRTETNAQNMNGKIYIYTINVVKITEQKNLF